MKDNKHNLNYVIVGATPNQLLERRFQLTPFVSNLNGVIRVKLSSNNIQNFHVGKNYYIMDADAFNHALRSGLLRINRPSTLVELTNVKSIEQMEYPYLNTWDVPGGSIFQTKDY